MKSDADIMAFATSRSQKRAFSRTDASFPPTIRATRKKPQELTTDTSAYTIVSAPAGINA